MPQLLKQDDTISILCKDFNVVYTKADPHFVVLNLDWMSQKFYIPSGCDSNVERDLNIALTNFELQKRETCICLVFNYKSSLWSKRYFFEVYESHIEYYYELTGKNSISNMHFFEGISAVNFQEHHFTKHFNDRKTTPYREYSKASPISFKKIFNPEPNVYSKHYFECFDYSLISVNSDFSDYCGGNFYFNPGTLCYLAGCENPQNWLSFGLAVKPGEYMFSDFEYIGGAGFGLNINYCGLFEVEEFFTSPKIVIFSGKSEKETLLHYINYLTDSKLIPESNISPINWWHGPIICPVGYQYYQTDLFRVRSPSERPKDLAGYFACTQTNSEKFIDLIDHYEIDWRIFIIDVKWFINAGQKIIDIGRWPNMKEFVENLHRRNKKVLIWWSPWDTEGWSLVECITYSEETCGIYKNKPGRYSKFDLSADKVKVAPDITLPFVQQKVYEQLTYLLGEDGINIDGLKMDHTASTPGLYGMIFPEGSKKIYGIELMHYYQNFLYKTAKSIKSDALILGQSPNPYFADCIDMIRLGDTYTHNEFSITKQMGIRWEMAKIANSKWLIDMDGWPLPSISALDEYIAFQAAKGVPSLYYATHLDTTGEEIPPETFIKIRDVWTEYLRKNKLNS